MAVVRFCAVLLLAAAAVWTIHQRGPEVAAEWRAALHWGELNPAPGVLPSEKNLAAVMRIHGRDAAASLHGDGRHVVWWLPGQPEIIGRSPGQRIDPVIEWQQAIMAGSLAPAAVRLEAESDAGSIITRPDVGAVVFLDQEDKRWRSALGRSEQSETEAEVLVAMPPAGRHLWHVRPGYLDDSKSAAAGAPPSPAPRSGLRDAAGVAAVWLGFGCLGVLACGSGSGRAGGRGRGSKRRSADRLLAATLLGIWWFLAGWLLWAGVATVTAVAVPSWLATSGAVWGLCLVTAGAVQAARHWRGRARAATRKAAISEPKAAPATGRGWRARVLRPRSARHSWVRPAVLALLAVAVLAAPAWYGWRSAQRTPFDVPAVQTHGYKVLLFAALERADAAVLTEAGREFCRPHYPHLFPLLVWAGWNWTAPPAAAPSDHAAEAGSAGEAGMTGASGVTLIPRAQQAHGSLAVAATLVLLVAGAVGLSGSWAAGLILAGLWAWSRPLQGMAGMFYAEPLLMLTTTFAVLSWIRALSALRPGTAVNPSGERLAATRSDLWKGGVALAAGILIKNEGVFWWLAAAGGMGLGLWLARRGCAGLSQPRPAFPARARAACRWLPPVVLPGLLAWGGWTGWRLMHGLGESDFSWAAFEQRGWEGAQGALLAALDMVWRWSVNGAAPFGGIWCLAVLLAVLLCLGGSVTRRADTGPSAAAMAMCAGFAVSAILAIVAVFPLSVLPSLENHLIAIWRLMLVPSIGALLFAASAWGLMFQPAHSAAAGAPYESA